MGNVRLLFYFSVLFVTEATINICIPLFSSGGTAKVAKSSEKFTEIKNDIVKKLSEYKSDSPEHKSSLYLNHIDLNLSHPALDLYGPLDDVKVYDLFKLKVCFLEHIFQNETYYQFDIFNATWPNVRVEGKYNLFGDLGDFFDLYGYGDFWLELRNLSVAIVDFTITVTNEICFPITINIDLHESGVHFDNFMFDDELGELLNAALTSILPETLQIIWAELKEMFDGPLEDEINNIFHPHNVASILTTLKSVKNVKDILDGALDDKIKEVFHRHNVASVLPSLKKVESAGEEKTYCYTAE